MRRRGLRMRVFAVTTGGLLMLAFAQRAQALSDVSPFSGCNEPSTAVVNPLNPQNVAVAECNGLAISLDSGRTFPVSHTIADAIPPGLVGFSSDGDGVVTFDSQGRLYWGFLIHNGGDVRVVVVRVNSTTGALQPSSDISSTGGSAPYNDDKDWVAADANPLSPFHDNVYVVWSNINTNEVEFSRSTDGGVTWSARHVVSDAGSEGFDWPSHVAVAPNGDVYAAYHTHTCDSDPTVGRIEVLRDSHAGADLAAGNAVQKSSFASSITCNVQSGSDTIPLAHFWMQGAQAPYVIPDRVRPGHIYVIANDDPDDDYSTAEPGDAIIARSTDNGQTWTKSQIGNPPANTLQVFPTAAMDPTGLLFVHWWDTRADDINPGPDGIPGTSDDYYNLDLYGTVSNDGGMSWTNDFRINDVPFDPDAGAPCRFDCGSSTPTLRIGEYNGIAAADGNGYVAWTGNGPKLLFDVVSLQALFPDRFEPNDSMQPGVPTDLGAGATYSEPDLSIHDSQDEDFFQLTALNTGSLTVKISQNSRLPDLDVQVRDKYANVLGTSTLGLDSNANEQVTIPVVAGQPYFVRVYSEANQLPPEDMYDLSAVNTPAPAPFGLALAPGSDSGRDAHDGVTNVNTPTIKLYADTVALTGLVRSPENGTSTPVDDNPGYKIGIYVNGGADPVGYASPAGGANPDQFTFAFPTALADGQDSINARVIIVDPSDDPSIGGTSHVVGVSGPSVTLDVTIDTVAPATPAAPDLLASSDTGGVSDDNITTIQTPEFAGTGEANALVRLYADGLQVGTAFMSPDDPGVYLVGSSLLGDGVYMMTAAFEDLAGNLSTASPGLKVTIAHASLTLPGGTASGPAGLPVTVDLAAGTISGFPGIAGLSGNIGIVGIPTVLVDANSNPLTINGTPGDDALTYTPTDPNGGNVAVAATGQALVLSGVGGPFTIDPLAGTDVVAVMGSANPNTVTANVDTTSTVQVDSFLVVSLPTANVERLAINTLDGADTINVNAADTVNATLSVDAGDPAPAKNKMGDVLAGAGTSPKAFVQNSPGGSTKGSGILQISYPKTTGTTVQIDYAGVEKVTK
jgi:hypothetical protein